MPNDNRKTCTLCRHRTRRNVPFLPPNYLLTRWVCLDCVESLKKWIVNVRVPGSGDRRERT